MISQRYLELGLTGLGRSVHSIWDTHFAAAVLAGFDYAARHALPADTERALAAQLDRVIAAKPALFEPYPAGETLADPADPIVEALTQSIDKFSELGHNAIFAAYALRALRDLGGRASAQNVRDIAALLRAFDQGPAHYWLRLAKGHDPRTFALPARTLFTDDLPAPRVAELVFTELTRFENIYRQMGSKSHIGHLLTQSHALLSLRELGFASLANRGFYSLECRVVLLRASQPHVASPRSVYRRATRSALLPTDAAYWAQDFSRCEWDEGHVFKYTYSFFELARLVIAGSLRDAAVEKLRYLISPNERSTSI